MNVYISLHSCVQKYTQLLTLQLWAVQAWSHQMLDLFWTPPPVSQWIMSPFYPPSLLTSDMNKDNDEKFNIGNKICWTEKRFKPKTLINSFQKYQKSMSRSSCGLQLLKSHMEPFLTILDIKFWAYKMQYCKNFNFSSST